MIPDVKEVLKPQRSVRNRLQSIEYDSQWIHEVHQAYNRPLVPNERCGLWYTDPQLKRQTAYFKSTDGHTSQWSFSTRRLNFHLLELINEFNGIILVDSTRRGKTIPDALSKTVPIWCATLNYIMNGGPDHPTNWLFSPAQFISKNEYSSMIKLIPEFAQRVIELGLITKDELQRRLKGKYLRPLWVYPGQHLPFEPVTEYESFHPVICCVASERSDDGMKKMSGFVYVQGAADDHELWASKLTPQLYWEHRERLLDKELNDDDILKLIDTLTLTKRTAGNVDEVVELISGLSIGQVVGDLTEVDIQGFEQVILLSEKFTTVDSTKVLRFPLSCTKKGSNELRKYLPELLSLHRSPMLILCETGTDLSTGVALALLSTRCDTSWERQTDGVIVTKDVIKKHLARILEVKKVNPSRATLQAVNTCVM